MDENKNCCCERLSDQEIKSLRRIIKKSEREEILNVTHTLLEIIIAQALRLNSEIKTTYSQEDCKSWAETAEFIANRAIEICNVLRPIKDKGETK